MTFRNVAAAGRPALVRAGLALAALLALAACSPAFMRRSPVPPAACSVATTTHDPALARTRLIAIAREAWEWWGERTIHVRGDRTIIEMATGPWEHEREAFRTLAAYWCATEPPRDYWQEAARDSGTREPAGLDGNITPAAFAATRIGHAPFADAWSAAFISWAMAGAGVPRDVFPRAAAHWSYVTALMRRYRDDVRTGAGDASAFIPHGIGDYAPRAGDLVCATRDTAPLSRPDDLLVRFRPMHCDIVVETSLPCPPDIGGTCLAAIGGNVQQAVSQTLVPTGRTGRIRPGSAGRDWIVVIENRLDRTPAHAAAAPPA